jgi:hypothetical protein
MRAIAQDIAAAFSQCAAQIRAAFDAPSLRTALIPLPPPPPPPAPAPSSASSSQPPPLVPGAQRPALPSLPSQAVTIAAPVGSKRRSEDPMDVYYG